MRMIRLFLLSLILCCFNCNGQETHTGLKRKNPVDIGQNSASMINDTLVQKPCNGDSLSGNFIWLYVKDKKLYRFDSGKSTLLHTVRTDEGVTFSSNNKFALIINYSPKYINLSKCYIKFVADNGFISDLGEMSLNQVSEGYSVEFFPTNDGKHIFYHTEDILGDNVFILQIYDIINDTPILSSSFDYTEKNGVGCRYFHIDALNSLVYFMPYVRGEGKKMSSRIDVYDFKKEKKKQIDLELGLHNSDVFVLEKSKANCFAFQTYESTTESSNLQKITVIMKDFQVIKKIVGDYKPKFLSEAENDYILLFNKEGIILMNLQTEKINDIRFKADAKGFLDGIQLIAGDTLQLLLSNSVPFNKNSISKPDGRRYEVELIEIILSQKREHRSVFYSDFKPFLSYNNLFLFDNNNLYKLYKNEE